jgi:hypothetical protein
MADNLIISATATGLPVGARIGALIGTLSGDADASIGPCVLCDVTGAEGSWVFTPVRMPTALGANGGLKVDIVGDTGTATVLDSDAVAAVTLNTKSMVNGSTTLTPKFAVIAAAASGNNTLVASVSGKKIRVLAYNFIANGTVNAKFQSGASGTDLTGLKYCVANGGISAPFNPVGWFETAATTLLNLNLSAAIAVGGELVYVEV